MSRARKFETTGTPVRSATTAASPICRRVGAAFVVDGLAVAADQLDGAVAADGAQNRAGVEFAEAEIQPGNVGQDAILRADWESAQAGYQPARRFPTCPTRGSHVRHAQNVGANRLRVSGASETDRFDPPAVDFDDGHVDARRAMCRSSPRDSHERFAFHVLPPASGRACPAPTWVGGTAGPTAFSSFCSSANNCRASMGRSSSNFRARMRSAMP